MRRLGWQIRGSTITTNTGDVIVLQNGKAVSRNGQQQSLDSLRSTFGQVVTEHLVQFAKSKGAIPLKQPDGSIKLSFKKGF